MAEPGFEAALPPQHRCGLLGSSPIFSPALIATEVQTGSFSGQSLVLASVHKSTTLTVSKNGLLITCLSQAIFPAPSAWAGAEKQLKKP